MVEISTVIEQRVAAEDSTGKLNKQHEHVFGISVPILASSRLNPLMYIRNLIP